MGHEMPDKLSERDVVKWNATEDQLPTPERRKELRRATLRYARLLPIGSARNELRGIARSLAFFERAPTRKPVGEKSPPALPRVANIELLRRW